MPDEEVVQGPSSAPPYTARSMMAGNLDRFLKSTTPIVPALRLSEEMESLGYFCFGDLWESFTEWSAYGVGVPLALNGSDWVVQYYASFLSGIQLFLDSSKPAFESSAESQEASNDSCDSDGGIQSEILCRVLSWQGPADSQIHALSKLTLEGAPVEVFNIRDGTSIASNWLPVFEYMEWSTPYSREPLADKRHALAKQFPEIKTYKSYNLLPSSWMSVAWYPIYKIPTGCTLCDLDACFLTFHSLATPTKGANVASFSTMKPANVFPKLSLSHFGLASYKVKGPAWMSNESEDRQQVSSLMLATDNWLRKLRVHHPDFAFFASHGAYREMQRTENPLHRKEWIKFNPATFIYCSCSMPL